jgi:hypothetical protein
VTRSPALPDFVQSAAAVTDAIFGNSERHFPVADRVKEILDSSGRDSKTELHRMARNP